jgi:hypothetical protein
MPIKKATSQNVGGPSNYIKVMLAKMAWTPKGEMGLMI